MEIRAGRTCLSCWTKHFSVAPKVSGVLHCPTGTTYVPNVTYYLLVLSIEQFLFVPVHPSVDVAGIFENRLIQDEVERGPFPTENLVFILSWCAVFSDTLSDKYDLVFPIFSFIFLYWGRVAVK